MSVPTFKVKVAFGQSRPMDTAPTFVDIAAQLEQLAINRGRSTEEQQAQTGTCALGFRDDDRRFDPNYAGELINLLTDPGFKGSLAAWNLYHVSLAADATHGQLYGGAAAMTCTSAGDALIQTDNYDLGGLVPGSTYTFSIWVYIPSSSTGTWQVLFYDDVSGDYRATIVVVSARDQWTRVAVTRTIRASADQAFARLENSTMTLGDKVWVAGAQLEEGAVASDYCDGDQDNCRWAGTANASQSYRGGPYYPNVRPMLQTSIVATLDATDYPVFFGWGDTQDCWLRTESSPGFAEVTTSCNDGFDVVGADYLDPSLVGAITSGQLTGARIGVVLDAVGWFAALRDLDAGYEPMQAATAGKVAALSLIRDAETTEPGYFYFKADGTATFRDRRSRYRGSSKATFCDSPNYQSGYVMFTSITTRQTPIYNDVTTTRNGGTAQEAQDTGSTGMYLTRSVSYSTQHETDAAALQLSQFQLNRYKDTYERLESLTLTPGDDSPTWLQVLSREIGDRITVIRTPAGGGSAVTADYYIEAVALTFGPGIESSCTWRLTAAPAVALWHAGTAGYSEAGSTTRAVY